MSNPSVITLRVSSELKDRLVALAKQEGVSMNQLVTYALTEKVTAMEMREQIEARMKRIEGKSKDELRHAARAAFDRIKARQAAHTPDESDIPEWDRWPEELRTKESLAKPAKAGHSKRHIYQPQPSQPSMAVHEQGSEYGVKEYGAKEDGVKEDGAKGDDG